MIASSHPSVPISASGSKPQTIGTTISASA